MYMDEAVLCPKCETPLTVPRVAEGKRARCPVCNHRFVISFENNSLEDTISHWIEEDVEEIFEERDHDSDQQQEQQHSEQHPDNVKAESQQGSDPDGSKLSGDDEVVIDSPLDVEHDRFFDDDFFVESLQAGPDVSTGDGSTITAIAFDADVHKQSCVDHIQSPDPQSQKQVNNRRSYPGDFQVKDDIPHLVVQNCSATGVRFAFDSMWLKHEGFRSSMPIRCVVSGDSNVERLIARPVLFSDRYRGQKLSIEHIHSQYENWILIDRSPRQITRNMGLIEKMPNPFQFAMPYYVHTRHAHHILHCQTHDHQGGGITCVVMIPNLKAALEWLGRVNGVCGPEYQMLEEDVSLMHGEAWRKLSETCRHRINAWCKLDPGESFRMYLTDADFGKRDEGMAGLVVTDKRVILCKYHHRGQVVRNNHDAAVHIKCDGNFAGLRLVIGDSRSKTLKIHNNDLKLLLAELHQSGGLRVLLDQNNKH